jgi:short subunit fatty acids transporter
MTTMAAQSRSKTLISDFAKEIWESTVLHGKCITLVSRLSEIAALMGWGLGLLVLTHHKAPTRRNIRLVNTISGDDSYC